MFDTEVVRDLMITVTDYGADPTGSSECGAAIQAALDAAAGTELLFPRGVYLSAGRLIVRTGTRVLGQGATLLLAEHETFWVRMDVGADRISVEGLTLDAAGKICPNGRVLTNNGALGRLRLIGVRILNSGGDPVQTSWQGGIYLIRGRGLISCCEVDGASTGIAVGQHQADDPEAAQDWTISSCRVTRWSEKAYEIRGGDLRPSGFRLFDCTATVPALGSLNAHGFWVDGRKSETPGFPENAVCDVRLHGCRAEGDDTADTTGDLITLRGVEGGVVTACVSRNGGDKGITLSYGCHEVTVSGCRVERSDSDGLVMGFDDPTRCSEVTRSFALAATANSFIDIGQARARTDRPLNFGIRAQNGDAYLIYGCKMVDLQPVPTSDNCVRVMPSMGAHLALGFNTQHFVGPLPASAIRYGVVRSDGWRP